MAYFTALERGKRVLGKRGLSAVVSLDRITRKLRVCIQALTFLISPMCL